MKNETKQRLFAIIIGLTMLGSVAGFALMQAIPEQKKVELPNVINRLLAPEDRVAILQQEKALIELVYTENCTTCPEKSLMYEEFVNSNEFKDYVVLESVEVVGTNDTYDRMISIYEITDLSNITSIGDLQRTFCAKADYRPEVCLLYEI